MGNYGKELILDLHNCDIDHENCTREFLEIFCIALCELIDMERCDLHFWDYSGYEEEYQEAEPHLKGTSLVQFIKTSNITIHTLDEMKRVYLNIFSCKDFNAKVAGDFCLEYFGGEVVNATIVNRI
jgi:S-adenosylmethionine/arginine decarboxylase-like enzyme